MVVRWRVPSGRRISRQTYRLSAVLARSLIVILACGPKYMQEVYAFTDYVHE